jgi:hypothetical protein
MAAKADANPYARQLNYKKLISHHYSSSYELRTMQSESEI